MLNNLLRQGFSAEHIGGDLNTKITELAQACLDAVHKTTMEEYNKEKSV